MLSDTHPDAERVQIELLRRKTPAERLAMARRLSELVVRMSREAIARGHPDWTPRQVNLAWMEISYGRELADEVREHLDASS